MSLETLEKIATRQAYGEELAALGAEYPELVVLDADLSNSTGTAKFAKLYPERFFNMGIAEQNMISTAAGLALEGKIPFASSFAMFATGRAWEQVRNSVAHNDLNVKIAATHAGITLGEDGASHQIIEDIAIMSVIPKMTVVVPADAVETKAAIRAAVQHKGPMYIRLGRPPVPVIFPKNDFRFELGKANVIRQGSDVTIVAVGVMLHIAINAAQELSQEGIQAEIINLSTIKPLDETTILNSVSKTKCLVVAEEHNYLNGVNALVASCVMRKSPEFVPMEVVAIQDRFGQSGTYDKLMNEYGLTAQNIIHKTKAVVSRKNR
jgi:transketolase